MHAAGLGRSWSPGRLLYSSRQGQSDLKAGSGAPSASLQSSSICQGSWGMLDCELLWVLGSQGPCKRQGARCRLIRGPDHAQGLRLDKEEAQHPARIRKGHLSHAAPHVRHRARVTMGPGTTSPPRRAGSHAPSKPCTGVVMDVK